MIKKILKGERGSGLKGILFIIGIFAIAFFAGEGVGLVKEKVLPASNVIENGENWGLGFGESGTQPTGTESPEVMKKYNAFYIGSGDKKEIYLLNYMTPVLKV